MSTGWRTGSHVVSFHGEVDYGEDESVDRVDEGEINEPEEESVIPAANAGAHPE